MKRRIFSLITLAGLLTLGACSDSYLDVNTDPNNATSSTPDLVLSAALNATAGRLTHHEIGAFWSGQWSPTGSVSGFTIEKTYSVTADFRQALWTGAYDNLNDYQYVETRATELKQPAFVGIAKTMKAFNFQLLVDAYGNIPYTDALKGTASIRPKYDDAQAIYEDLIKQLDAAIVEMNKPIAADNPSPGGADIVFKGNMTKWVHFANTLKLRILIRQSNIASREAYIKAEIAKITGGYLGAGEDVLSDPGYQKSAGKLNPFYENYGFTASDVVVGTNYYTYSDFYIQTLKGFSDPRLARVAYRPTDAAFSGDYRGVPFGEGNDIYTTPKVSAFGPAFAPTAATAGSSDLYKRPQVIMLAAEGFFLQAEAAQRGYTAGNAKALYQQGIVESFRYLGVASPATAVTTYLEPATPNVNWEASTNKIEAIITQKWIANTTVNGYEAWTEFRRTGFPKVPLSTRAQVQQHPLRLLYPNSELGTNPENVKAQGEVTAFTKLFWEK